MQTITSLISAYHQLSIKSTGLTQTLTHLNDVESNLLQLRLQYTAELKQIKQNTQSNYSSRLSDVKRKTS